MRYETWVRKFRPIRNHLAEDTAIDGYVFMPYGEELNFVLLHPKNQIWSFVVCDDGRKPVWLISEGFHVVNLIGYLLTRMAFNPAETYAVRY